ncbi:hypothetical protein K440DRAFT_616564 [Wilcoxina mikolae CBS 423.85]|nr:hypothetical protein K440DRAFT_616564 [Wilcoxina mikolae CBS 423.85]
MDGFPITSLREVTTLMAAREHPNVVKLREVVMGDTLKELPPPTSSPPPKRMETDYGKAYT